MNKLLEEHEYILDKENKCFEHFVKTGKKKRYHSYKTYLKRNLKKSIKKLLIEQWKMYEMSTQKLHNLCIENKIGNKLPFPVMFCADNVNKESKDEL